MISAVYNFNYGWRFRLADAFPLGSALEATKDCKGRFFYETEYQEEGWEEVGLPHTFNDEDLFLDRIQDAGSGQKRTFSCYRKWFEGGEILSGVRGSPADLLSICERDAGRILRGGSSALRL